MHLKSIILVFIYCIHTVYSKSCFNTVVDMLKICTISFNDFPYLYKSLYRVTNSLCKQYYYCRDCVNG